MLSQYVTEYYREYVSLPQNKSGDESSFIL